jgi:hypothetical protein
LNGYDAVGNRQSLSYANGVTNLYQYDPVNRLTNLAWKKNGGILASFAYQLGPTGIRTNLSEMVYGNSQTYGWSKFVQSHGPTAPGPDPTWHQEYLYPDDEDRPRIDLENIVGSNLAE